jgi:hypothetical protein
MILRARLPANLENVPIHIDELFWFVKRGGGFSEVRRAQDVPELVALLKEGDKLGSLWKQGLMQGADPK